MRPIVRGFFCLSLLTPFAFAQNAQPAATTDQAFVDLVAQTDMTEAHLGKLAAENASSQAVKDYAQMLVTDHTADYDQITAVATKAGLSVPKAIDEAHQKEIAPLEKLKGAAFDRRYIAAMVRGHETAIAAYNKQSRDGQNADLKSYAAATLPTLEKHRSGAQDLMKQKK